VSNGLNHTVELVRVSANFYSSSGQLLASQDGFACLTALPAGGDSSHTVLLTNPPAGISNVTVHVDNYFGPPILFPSPVGLSTTVTDTYLDWINYQHVVGYLSLPHFSGHLDCSEMFAQKGVQDGYTIPGRVPRTGGGVSAAA
jgi:hypothetical protein